MTSAACAQQAAPSLVAPLALQARLLPPTSDLVQAPLTADTYRLGSIEGFFGRAWSMPARHAHLDFLAEQGFNSYVYAPKADAMLRKRWMQPYAPEALQALATLAAHARQRGLDFGLGLSPFELYRHFDAPHEAALVVKLQQLNEIGATTLCVLFDDMQGDLAGLAERQVAIMDCVRRYSSATHLALCPTYYSSDPLLAKLFGSPPERYLEELGELLPADIDVFWTGPQVISREYPAQHLQQVARQLRRKPLLWDNYPVNDAQRLTGFLHLLPFRRNCSELRALCAGHLANPMNQATLSQLPLRTLARQYQGCHAGPEELLQEACESLFAGPLGRCLREDAERFQHMGLGNFSAQDRDALLQRYKPLLPHVAAVEVVDWLNGGYEFDPACLT